MKKWLALCICVFLWGCAQDPDIQADIIIAANQSSNPILDLEAAFQGGGSRGIFFRLDPLSNSPTGINDTTGTTTQEPSSGIGMNPKSKTFSLKSELLNPGVRYRLRMVAIDSGGNVTHIGTGDCPIFSGMQNQTKIKICFGLSSGPNPVCGGLTPFGCCEGINSVACNQ